MFRSSASTTTFFKYQRRLANHTRALLVFVYISPARLPCAPLSSPPARPIPKLTYTFPNLRPTAELPSNHSSFLSRFRSIKPCGLLFPASHHINCQTLVPAR